MRQIKLKQEEERVLERLYRHSGNATERRRAHCLLLSHRGSSINELSRVFDVRRSTISGWLKGWESRGLESLRVAQGRGRKKKLAGLAPELIEGYVEQQARNLRAVAARIGQEHGVEVSKKTLQRFLKR